jgi:mono/diheme cytochrome c family protein
MASDRLNLGYSVGAAPIRKWRRRLVLVRREWKPMNLDVAKLFAGIVTFAGAGSIAHAADADHGELVAKRWCAACHIVAPNQKQGADNVPTFASIGKRPDFNMGKLASFSRDPHPKMPNMALTRRESDDIAAYIDRAPRALTSHRGCS